MVATLSRDDLKNRILEHLRATPQTQYENVMEIGLERPLGRRLTENETQDVLEILHELLTANILMPASNRRSAGWPFFGLTAHGKEVIRTSGPPVYDYEAYLADLRGRVPELDAVIERFLIEALQAYQRQLFLCSVAMLGCASERGIWSLINTYLTAIKDVANRDKLRSRIAGRDISVAYRRFRESFDSAQG